MPARRLPNAAPSSPKCRPVVSQMPPRRFLYAGPLSNVWESRSLSTIDGVRKQSKQKKGLNSSWLHHIFGWMKCHHWLSVSYKLISAIDGDAITNYGMISLLNSPADSQCLCPDSYCLAISRWYEAENHVQSYAPWGAKVCTWLFSKNLFSIRVTHWRSQEKKGWIPAWELNPIEKH